MKKVFIVGAPRSGTSWMHFILKHHPQVVTGGESHLFPTIVGPLSDPSKSIEQAAKEVLRRFDELMADTNSTLHKLGSWVQRETLEELLEKAGAKQTPREETIQWILSEIFDEFAAFHRVTDSHVIVEKTPTHAFFVREILSMFPEALVIEMLRDGRDVVVSLDELSQIADWPPKDRQAQIRMWQEHVSAMLNISSKKEFSGRIITIYYENLRQNTEAEMKRAFELIGLSCSKSLLDLINQLTGRSELLNLKQNRYLGKGRIGAWRESFSDEDVSLFKSTAGQDLISLGYEENLDWDRETVSLHHPI